VQKDHLIQLHAFLIQIRNYIEMIYQEDGEEAFAEYDSLHIYPHEVHKSKDKQQLAIFELMKSISYLLSEKDPEHFGKISQTLDEYCTNLKNQGEEEHIPE
jgi:hypothetical protein